MSNQNESNRPEGWFARAMRGLSGATDETFASFPEPEDPSSSPVDANPENDSSALLDDDSPIRTASQDRFGVDPFAGIVARALANQGAAEGTVIALNGPWGAGKSSAVNLVIQHLHRLAGDDLEVVPFNPWWFSGSDQLARAFLSEIANKIGRTMKDDGRDALKGMLARLSKFDTYVDAARRAGDDGLGSGAASLLFEARSVEEDHRRLAAALHAGRKRFVIVIDDIDRLNPDEALQMFQLVKSVGRLPHVSYLLAFDRLLIERLLHERYPAEGGRYLEKVLQATFDLPEPSPAVLREMAYQALNQLADVPEENGVRFMNMFEDIVVPRLTSPRQVVRYLGSLRVSWPVVGDDVDPADFMSIEAIRVFEPGLYRAVRNHGALVRGEDQVEGHPRDQRDSQADAILLAAVEEPWKGWAKTALQRLFPPLEGVWGNVSWGREWRREWDAQRLICSAAHFPTYFSYAVPAETLTEVERRTLIEATADPDRLKSVIRLGIEQPGSNGGTRAALMLAALQTLGDRVPIGNVPTMLKGLFAIADDLAVKADESRGFSTGDNFLRLHWLINEQVRERLSLEERGPVLAAALAVSQIGWKMSLSNRLFSDYEKKKDEDRGQQYPPMVDEATARQAKVDATAALLAAAEDGTLIASNQAGRLIWRLIHESRGEDLARSITDQLLASDDGIVRLSEMVTSTSWSSSMGFGGLGDRVARASPRVQREGLERIVDPDRLQAAALSLSEQADLSDADRHSLRWFLQGWNHRDDDD
jgi:predicted KAP-like P-loop ATPase